METPKYYEVYTPVKMIQFIDWIKLKTCYAPVSICWFEGSVMYAPLFRLNSKFRVSKFSLEFESFEESLYCGIAWSVGVKKGKHVRLYEIWPLEYYHHIWTADVYTASLYLYLREPTQDLVLFHIWTLR